MRDASMPSRDFSPGASGTQVSSGCRTRWSSGRSGDILLVVDVADTSGGSDRDVKLPLYAAAGIPEAWLVDLANDAIEVHRQPAPEGYREVRTLGRGDTLSVPLVAVGGMSVDDVLGPRL